MNQPADHFDERDAARILRHRARELARREPDAASAGTSIEVLEFKLAQERWALETSHVAGVCPFEDLTPLPGVPPFVRGIVSVRGRILPVYDLKRFFDLPDQGLTDLHSIILVQGGGMELGLLVDATVGVRTIPTDSLQLSVPTFSGIRGEYLKGVTAEPLVVLDVARILADPRIIVHEEALEP